MNDIEVLEEWLKEMDELYEKTHINNTKERNALRNLLKERQSDKERMKDLEYIIARNTTREVISDLKSSRKSKEDLEMLDEGWKIELKKNYITKSLVKEKLKEEKLPLTIVGGRRNGKTLEYGKKLGRIEMCKELLGEEK